MIEIPRGSKVKYELDKATGGCPPSCCLCLFWCFFYKYELDKAC